ncbi:MAG: tyrosine-type recombinase/integrase [Planctomycetota bacterium]
MVYRKQYTMPIPPGAEITERDGQRIARWRLRNGQLRSAEVVDCKDGKLRVRGQSRLYMARYRDGSGQVVEVATGCKDEIAARAVLTHLERRAELVRAGVMSPAENDAADHASLPLSKHLDAYEKHLSAKGGDPRRISMLRSRLERLIRDCRFSKLNKMSAGTIEQWLVEQAEAGLSASTRNSYREAAVCFGNWCRRTHRLTQNPFADVSRADQNADRRHQRRALTQPELMRLLKVARLRPLAEYGREITPKKADSARPTRSRATWTREPLSIDNIDAAVERAREALKYNPDLIAQLEQTGRERALMYKTLVLTGLRKGELASLTVGQLDFNGPVAYAVLNAADEKNRQGSNIPLRADLATELSSWLAERLDELQEDARKSGNPIPARLPASTPLFCIPSGLARILDRDLAAAGIPKRDERNRVVDVHALRVTFGTHLCAAGVPLRTAQAAMRHSKPELTANIYTDPKLLDIAGAINALPALTIPSPPIERLAELAL